MKPQKKPMDTSSPSESNEEYLAKKARYDERRNKAVELGYDIGAVVVPRNTRSVHYLHDVENWGIVCGHAHYHLHEAEYKPLRVHWFSKYKKQETYHDPQELYIVHAAVPRDELELMFQLQDEEFKDAC